MLAVLSSAQQTIEGLLLSLLQLLLRLVLLLLPLVPASSTPFYSQANRTFF